MQNYEVRHVLRFDCGIQVSRPWLNSDPIRAQQVFAKHAEERVYCMCRGQGVPMHIVNRAGTFHLASLPGRARLHDRGCPSYIEDQDAFGLQYYSDKAISVSADRYHLTLASAPLSDPPFGHLTPNAALQVLWQVAGLCDSHPSYISSRTNGRALSRIAKVANRFRINTEKLVLYLPFRDQSPAGCRYVVGPVYSITSGPYSAALKLCGDFEHTYWIHRDEWDLLSLDRFFGSFHEPVLDGSFYVFAKLWSSKSGSFHLYQPGFLRVTANLLPCFGPNESCYDYLIDRQREFSVIPRLDSPSSATLPLVVCDDRPQPQFLYSQDL